MITGILAATLSCVPLLGALLGIAAVLLFIKSRAQRRRLPVGQLHGGWLGVVGVILGGFGLTFGLLVTALVVDRFVKEKRELDAPITFSTRDRIATFDPRSGGFVFARSGNTWGTLWTNTRRTDTGQLDIVLYCREEIYLSLLNDALELEEQQKLIERPCVFRRDYNLLAVDGGFAATYVDGGELRLARFDLAKRKLTHEKPLLASGSEELLARDSMGDTLATFRQGDKIILAAQTSDDVRVLGARPGDHAAELLRVALSSPTYRPTFSGAFGPPSLFVWMQSVPGGLEQKEVAYALSSTGERIDKTGTIRRFTAFDINLAVLRDPEEFSVFIDASDEIWRQRLGLDGAPLGVPELLVHDAQGIFNFNASQTDQGCFLMYTVGNFDLRSYSCRTRKVEPVGDRFDISLGCAGAQCLYSHSSTVRWIDPSRPAAAK